MCRGYLVMADDAFLEMISQGRSLDDVLSEMRRSQVSIPDAIRIVRAGYGVELGTAKRIVVGHRSWRDVAQKGASVHDALFRAAQSGDN